MTEDSQRAKLVRLARLFRQHAQETVDPEFRAKFLSAAEELERSLDVAPDGKTGKTPR
jgi:hypothetical protein